MTTSLYRGLRLALAATALVALTACGQDPARYDTADELATALAEANIVCPSPEPLASATLVASGAACGEGEAKLSLYVFSDEQKRDDWLLVGAQLSHVAVGPNWAVSGSAQVVDEVAAALHGEVEAPQ